MTISPFVKEPKFQLHSQVMDYESLNKLHSIKKIKVLLRYPIFKMQYLFKEMLFWHTVFNISVYRTCTIMFSEKNSIYSKHSFSVTMVTQCPSTAGICIKETILQGISHNATVIKIMIFSTKST